MDSIRGSKRRRQVQDENEEFPDNFAFLRAQGELKRRKITADSVGTDRQTCDQDVPFKAVSSQAVFKTPHKTPLTLRKWRHSLRRRVSLSVRKKTLKHHFDYSLPFPNDPQYMRFMTIYSDQSGKGRDHELQQKIDVEIKMRDGTVKLLAAAKHPAQMLEAAKSLLTSNTRMISYMSELQKRKTDEVMGKNQCIEGNQVPCKAKVAISDIRIPLMWKDTDHFKNKGDHRRYAVFCLLKIGTEIFDTSLVKDVDRSMTDITFPDSILFHNIPHNFECQLEVYSHNIYDDLTIASTPKKIKKRINDLSSSMGRSVGRRLSGLKDDFDSISGSAIIGPKFEMIGSATLRLGDVSDETGSFDLQLDSTDNTNELPLFGHFCCRLAAQPLCLLEQTTSGSLYVQNDNGGWVEYWCSLKNLRLSCWRDQSDVDMTEPDIAIPVTKQTQVSDADPATMRRPHTFHIYCRSTGRSEWTLAAEDSTQLKKWWDGLQQHMLDQVLWKHACEELLEIKSPSPQRKPFERKGSLYDEIRHTSNGAPPSRSNSVFEDDSSDSPLTKIYNRLTRENSRSSRKSSKSSRDS